MRSHIKRVHSIETNEPFLKCEECSCTFKKVGSLNAHYSRVHAKITNIPAEEISDIVDSKKDDDLLFKALNSTGLPSIAPEAPQESSNVKKPTGSMVLADKSKSGKKHLVKIYQNQKGQKMFLCNFCPKEFGKPSDLCRHLRVHSLEKPFKCRLCSRSFAVKSAFSSHMKIHTSGGKDHLCSVCLKRFKNPSLRRQHEQNHFKKDTPAAQETIDVGEPLMVTSQGHVQAMLPRHRAVYQYTRKELMERNHRCTSCPAAFKKVAHLKAHNFRHTGEKPFSCGFCDK